jgi:polysaccharide export outer membrane protein
VWALIGIISAFGQEGASVVGARPSQAVSTYVLGPDDSVSILALEADEISGKVFHIDDAGYVSIPLAGRFSAAGLTVDQFEVELKRRLQQFIRNPELSITVSDRRSQPVSVLGAVVSPGVHQLRGSRRLLDVISLAGGLRPDAGAVATITRDRESGSIPSKTSVLDPTGKFYVAEVNFATVAAGSNPEENVLIRARDVVSIPPADKVYAIGDVARPGAFSANDGASLLQVLSMAGGLNKTASAKKAVILRTVLGGPKRATLSVDIKRIMAGNASDLPIMPGDILFVPSSQSKIAVGRTLQSLIQYAPYMLTYGLIR